MHVQNYSLTWNSVLSTHMTNQLFAGVNYYNQSFSDQNTHYDPTALGLNTGVTDPALAGSPRIQIASPSASSGLGSSANGFDYVGATVNSGRNDITGHLDEALSWTVGKHEFRFGGEFRQAQIDDFYQSGERGTFVFDGTQGPWSGATGTPCDALATATGTVPTSTDPHINELADFLAGCFDPGVTNIVQGDPKRQVFVNSWAIFAQDAWQLSPRFYVNYGLRYEYIGPMHNGTKDLSTFLPGATNGIAIAGSTIPTLYPQWYGGASPRAGFSWQPTSDGKTVVRASFGLGFDSPNVVNLLNSRFSSNGGPFGVQDNPAGATPVEESAPVVGTIPTGAAYGSDIFLNESSPSNPCILDPNAGSCPSVNLFSVSQHLRPGYVENFNFNLQQSLGAGAIAQLGYVGSQGRHLRDLVDINQINIALATPARPYATEYPNYGVIN